MNLSVVIPTYNRVDRLKRVLAALEKQTYPVTNYEVIVVSDGSIDDTNEYMQTVETSQRLIFIEQTNSGPATARNRGLERATGEIVLFIDDDVVPSPNLLAEHLRCHESYQEDIVVLGPMLTPPDFRMSSWIWWEQTMLVKQYTSMLTGKWKPTARQFYTGNSSVARRHLIEVGGFDPTFRRAEDLELAYRLADLGLDFVFNSEAIGHHYAERSFNSWLDIPYVYGRNDVIFTKQLNQGWILPNVFREFWQRHLLIQVLVYLNLDRPRLTRLIIGSMKSFVKWQDHTHHTKWTNLVCSCIFNYRYYQGVADELGGRHLFFQGVKKAKSGT